MQFKKSVLLAERIIPGKTYLWQGRPCTVICTETTGWKRGYVELGSAYGRYYARIETLFDHKIHQVALTCTPKDFWFADMGRPTLLEYDHAQSTIQLNAAKTQIEELQKQLATLEQLKAVLMKEDGVFDLSK